MQYNEDVNIWDDSDEAFEERRRQRAARMEKRKRAKQLKIKRRRIMLGMVAVSVAAVVIAVFGIKTMIQNVQEKAQKKAYEEQLRIEEEQSAVEAATAARIAQKEAKEQKVVEEKDDPETIAYSFSEAENRKSIPGEVVSTSVIFIDKEKGEIIAGREEKTRMNPASMTKILTVLVAAEQVDDLEDTFTITRDITDYGYINDCSAAGFLENETVTVKDLFYGTILPSGADAGLGLATYVAGSHEAFVELMNQKLQELGISETTHFTNCVGIYDENHYSTPYDMAVIMRAALDNELCREVLSTKSYTTSKTEQHPEGIIISNWFLRRIEDKDTGGEVICAKTGFVAQSGSCAASYGKSSDGREYICVTAGSSSSWRCIYDHVELYKNL